MQKVDILAIGAHPDDIELCIGGTLLKAIAEGNSVGLCDMTAGELGSNGSAEIRAQEANNAFAFLGAKFRVNLGLKDGFFSKDEASLKTIARVIRQCQPDTLLIPAPFDRHPDHGRAANLVLDAVFISGLIKIELFDENKNPLLAWRPKLIFHYIQDIFHQPDFVVDISAYFESKLQLMSAYETQFYAQKNTIPTPINGSDFLGFVEGRAREMGRTIGVQFGEGYLKYRPLKIENFKDLY